MARYLFFYKNFIGTQYHWCFEHVWSLCVEEHFYLLFPLLFVLSGWFFRKKVSVNLFLFSIITAVILLSIILRYVLIEYFGSSINQYECTLVRVHELAIGVLMGLIFVYYEQSLKKCKQLWIVFVTGLLIFLILLYVNAHSFNSFFHKHLFPVAIPFTFLLMMTGIYFVDFSRFTVLRIIAFCSYNWYLWHTLFVKFISIHLFPGILGMTVYLLFTFLLAVFFTFAVEETFLRYRTSVLNKYFQ